MTTVPGLYAAGANSGLEGSSYACASGLYAGNRAAEYAAEACPGKIREESIQAEKEKLYAPVKRWESGDDRDHISWKELWAGSTRVMQQCCGCLMKKRMDAESLPEDSYIFCRQSDGEVKTRYEQSQYWLKEPNETDYLKNYEACRAKENKPLCFAERRDTDG